MNPVAISRGHSFKGITAYLHGQNKEARATWSEVLNVGTQNPYMAARFMAATAMDAHRKQPKGPVWHWQMSWDDQQHPPAEHQAEAAKALLKSLGLDNAQAMLVGHNDNGRTHVHLVVNLINPDTGRIWHDHRFPDNAQRNCTYQSHTKAQAFALEYCREHGITSSPNREKNAATREEQKATGEKAHPSQMEGRKRLSREDWQHMRDTLYARQAIEREALKDRHGEQWQQIKDELAKRQKAERAQWREEYARQTAAAKAEFRTRWRDTFKAQEAEARKSHEAMTAAAKQLVRANTWHGKIFGALGLAKNAFDAEAQLSILKMQHQAMQDRHEAARIALAEQRRQVAYERTKAAVEVARQAGAARPDIDAMKQAQSREWAQLRERQQAEREEAGIRHARAPDKAREQNNQPPRREREHQTQAKDNARKRDEETAREGRKERQYSKAQLERYRRWQEKEREAREKGPDRGRER